MSLFHWICGFHIQTNKIVEGIYLNGMTKLMWVANVRTTLILKVRDQNDEFDQSQEPFVIKKTLYFITFFQRDTILPILKIL